MFILKEDSEIETINSVLDGVAGWLMILSSAEDAEWSGGRPTSCWNSPALNLLADLTHDASTWLNQHEYDFKKNARK